MCEHDLYSWHENASAGYIFTNLVHKFRDVGFIFWDNPETFEHLYGYILECVHKNNPLEETEVFNCLERCPPEGQGIATYREIIDGINHSGVLKAATRMHFGGNAVGVTPGCLMEIPLNSQGEYVNAVLLQRDFPLMRMNRR